MRGAAVYRHPLAASAPARARAFAALQPLFGPRAGSLRVCRYSQVIDGSDTFWTEGAFDVLFALGPGQYIARLQDADPALCPGRGPPRSDRL